MTAATGITLLEQHPLSAAFPSMPEQEIAALALDIEEHGQREPGVLFEGMVLDGWHRYLACAQAGVEFQAVEFDGVDPVAFVISRNAHRRHLTQSQKAHAVAACAQWRTRGGEQSAPGALRPPTDADLAAKAGVSERTVEQAKATIRAGLGEELKAGKVSAKTGAEVAKLPPKKRAAAVEAIKAGEEPALPKPKAVIAGREVEKLYEAVKAELIDLQGKYADLLEKNADLADTARIAEDKVQALEATEPDEQQKLIMELQKKIQRKDGEIARLTAERNRLNDKCNQLIRQVKSLQKGKR